MEELIKNLEEAGLSGKESIVYLALLKNSPITGGKLAKNLNMDRTHTYNLLQNLSNKGLVNHTVKENKKFFQTNSPKNLLNSIQKKEQAIQSIMPKLEAIEKITTSPLSVKILQGKAGLRTIVRMLLKSKSKDILVYGGTGRSYDFLKYEMHHITEKKELLKMKGRIITGEKLRNHPFTKLSNFKIRYIQDITPSSTMIFGNKMSINVFDENPSIILIENKSIVESYKKYFEYLWKQAKS